MDVSLTVLPGSEIEITIALSPIEFAPHLATAAHLISEEVEIEGFRKGKAPYDVVKNRVGEHALYERAAEAAVRASYPKAQEQLIENGKLFGEHPAIGRPEVTITKLAPGNEFTYKIKMAVMPNVTLPDYRAIAKSTATDKKEQAVTNEEIEKAIGWLAESRMKLVAASRPAAAGDHVEVDFEIRHNGVKIAEGDSRNHPLVIGQGKFMPGFEDALIGMHANDQKIFTLAVPHDWREASVAGKSLDFNVTMKAVQERILPEITDEFAKGLGEFASLVALRANIREGLLAEKKEKENQRIRGAIIAEIAQQSNMELPAVLIASEIEKMTAELKAGISDLGMQWPDYLLHIKKTEKDIKSGWQDEAKNRVRAALALREIARKEHITPTEEEIAERTQQYLVQFKNNGEAAKNIDPAELRDYAQGILKNEKVFDLLEKTR